MSSPSPGAPAPLYMRPAELLQALIRFDTTNPPGDEAACIGYIDDLLRDAGLQTHILARDPARPNLVARLPGRGQAPPLLLYGHADVVTTAQQTWRHPPFAGTLADGYVWGRGALDMKGGLAMMLAAVLRAQAEGLALPGDVLLAVLSDEEAGGSYGARYLVEHHPTVFAGVRYALGEFGGFSLYLGGRKFYPIMVGEKQSCVVRATVRGPGGHGALILRGGAMARLGRLLTRLDTERLPVHITPIARQMIGTIAAALPAPLDGLLPQVLDPARTDAILDRLGLTGQLLDPLLHNTVNATIVRGGEKINVIPSAITVELDGRVLPGFGPADLLAELAALGGDGVAWEALSFDAGPATADLGLFDTLAGILREADPEGAPAPLLLSAVTDARQFGRLGIQTYGFLPMALPAGFDFTATIHAADERIPVAALEFGAEALYQALRRFGAAP